MVVQNKINLKQVAPFTITRSKNETSKNESTNNNDPSKSEDVYNPFEERNVKRPVSDIRSLANLLKASLGSGILAMPLAFSCAGLIPGTLGTIIIGYVCTHCAQILVRVSQNVCHIIKKPSLGYGETCGEAFANGPKCLRKYSTFIRHATDIALAMTNLSACCVYVVLVANSIEQLVESHYPDFDLSSSIYCVMLLVPFSFIVQINNMKHLAPFSAIANILLVSVCGISLYFIFEDMPSITERDSFVSITKLPLFLSTVIFAMEGIGCVMPVENEMLHPSHFLGCPGVLNVSMAIVVFLYTLLGFFGYVKYGSNALGSITLNLDINSMAAKVAKVCIIIAIYFTYPLQYYVPACVGWGYLKRFTSERYEKVSQVLLLTFGVMFTVCMGVALPKIDAIIEFVGAIFYSTLGLLVPALVETVFQWERDLGYLKWRLWKNMLIVIFALVALVCGVSHAVIQLQS